MYTQYAFINFSNVHHATREQPIESSDVGITTQIEIPQATSEPLIASSNAASPHTLTLTRILLNHPLDVHTGQYSVQTDTTLK